MFVFCHAQIYQNYNTFNSQQLIKTRTMAHKAIKMTISAGAAVTITPGAETVVVAAVGAADGGATVDLVARVTVVGIGIAEPGLRFY
jgi:hypothetical protein